MVQASDENGRVKKQLSERFQESIDAAAMALGLVGSDEYTNGFQWGAEIYHTGTAQEVAKAIAAEIELKYQRIDWHALAKKLAGE